MKEPRYFILLIRNFLRNLRNVLTSPGTTSTSTNSDLESVQTSAYGESKEPGWWARNWLNMLFLTVAFGVGSFVILALIMGYNSYLTLLHTMDVEELAKWGTFGDYVGGLSGSIFNFFSFVLLLLTILLQVQEMRYSREELEKTTEALRRQNENQKHINFENTFFQLLQLHHDHANNLMNYEEGKLLIGRQCFAYFYRLLKEIYEEKKANFVFAPHLSYTETEQEIIRAAYQQFYNRHQAKLGHYFRNLYNIVKFVEKHYEGEQAKQDYMKMIRAQFSSYELVLIFYNCLFFLYEYKEVEFYQLVEKYLLLKNLPNRMLFKDMHYDFYPENFANIAIRE